LKSTDKKE